MTNTLQITVEDNQVISRFNGEGEGAVIAGFVNEAQVNAIIEAHNASEQIAPSKRNAKAIRV